MVSSEKKGVYIPKKNTKLISGLAQKDYDEKVIKAAMQEIKAIDAYLSTCGKVEPEKVYEELHEARRALVIPITETDEMFRSRWESEEYVSNPYAFDSSEYFTWKGERVRSKSEIIIADSLAKADIPYRYEKPLYLNDAGTIYPDFTVLNLRLRKEYYWEHFGIMDDPEYAEKAIRKLSSYYANGIYPGDRLILTWETSNIHLNVRQIKELIEHYFM